LALSILFKYGERSSAEGMLGTRVRSNSDFGLTSPLPSRANLSSPLKSPYHGKIHLWENPTPFFTLNFGHVGQTG
jgi:hypothetical protein